MDKLKTAAKKFWELDYFINVKGVNIPVVKTLVAVFVIGAIIF